MTGDNKLFDKFNTIKSRVKIIV